ncbi:hypothetical protein CK203_090493 [Vitis vinifera]|uniref:CCHC-type domain-containing protein n=1 Tax=Vitis vinifera TaxID=29760 RepID=A0A438BTU6_VITVI|nr:hypothetical protein CK203_090493 [Vitis vinifera]
MNASVSAMLHRFSKSSNNYMVSDKARLDVNTYYTRLKILWDELKNYQPVPVFHYGVFNLVVQEEHQRSIGSGSSAPSDSMAFNTFSLAPSVATASSHKKPRRERPICTQCGLTGHTVDRCYKLHGFPLGHSLFLFCCRYDGILPPPASLSLDQVQRLIAYLSTHVQQQTINPLESPSVSRP